MRLAQRDSLAITVSQASKARRRSLDNLDAKVTITQAVQRKQLARGDRDRAGFVGEAEQFSLEIGDAFDLRSRNQTIYRIIKFPRDRDGIRAIEHGANQKRRRDVRDVGGVVVQCIDHLVRAARNGHDDFEI